MVSEHASPLAVLGGVDAGGQNVHVAALAAGLGRRGASVVVHTRRDSPVLPRRVDLAPGVEVDHVDAGPAEPVPKDDLLCWMGDFAEDLARTWEHDRPDVVHAHFWMSGLAAMTAARPLGIPVVMTFHALGVVKRRHQGSRDTSPAAREGIEARLAREADHVIATCSDEVFELMRLGTRPSQVTVVPCGVDLSLFGPSAPPAGKPPGNRRLLVVGRLVERKGTADVIEALAEVPDTELVVAGGPSRSGLRTDPEACRLRETAERAGVSDRVRLLGRVDHRDLPGLIRSAHAVVCVPWYEPFGIVPLEAMACGVPVVASSVGGLVDTVVHGVTGMHVPPRSPAALATALRELLDRPEWLRSMGRAGRARATNRYGWDRVTDSTLGVYRTMAAAGRPAQTTRGRR